LSKFNFSDDIVFLFLQSNNQQKTIQATKERAKTKCSVCQGFGHTKPTCPQKGAPAGGLPAPVIGSGSGGLQIEVQQPKKSTRKRQQEDDSGDESGSDIGDQEFSGLQEGDSDADSDADEEDEEEHADIEAQIAANSSSSSSSDSPQRISEWRNSGLSVPAAVKTLRETRTGEIKGIQNQHQLPAFLVQNPGPQKEYLKQKGVTFEKEFSCVQYFLAFFCAFVLGTFVASTNSYGDAYIAGWTELTVDEFKAFLAVIIYFGYIKYPNRTVAFERGEFGSPFVRRLFTLQRFNSILRAWHWEDYSKTTDADRKVLKKKDPFWIVQSFAVHLSAAFAKAFFCHQFIDIDEQSVPWKGRHKCRCYNPAKPAKFHFKIFALNDSLTRYQPGFYLYGGASEQRPAQWPATVWPIVKLLAHVAVNGMPKWKCKTCNVFMCIKGDGYAATCWDTCHGI
jgi:Transposase IS4